MKMKHDYGDMRHGIFLIKIYRRFMMSLENVWNKDCLDS